MKYEPQDIASILNISDPEIPKHKIEIQNLHSRCYESTLCFAKHDKPPLPIYELRSP